MLAPGPDALEMVLILTHKVYLGEQYISQPTGVLPFDQHLNWIFTGYFAIQLSLLFLGGRVIG